jgi:hypothetical protein
MKYAHFDPASKRVMQLLDTEAFNYTALPPSEALITLTEEQHAAAHEGLWAVVDGQLTAVAESFFQPPAPSFATLKAIELAAWRADREKMLNRLAGIGMAAQAAADMALVTAIVNFRQGLLDLPSHPTVTDAIDITGLRAAVKTRYNALLAATPAAAKLAFKGVDA